MRVPRRPKLPIMIPLRSLYLWTALLALQTLLAVATPTTQNNIKRAASSGSEDTVNTPAGSISKSRLHRLPHGARIEHTESPSQIHIVSANGTTIQTIHPSSDAPLSRRALSSGYDAYFYWGNTAPAAAPLALFTTSFDVPPLPENTNGSQLIYLFNALQPGSGVSRIVQPVLQYGVSAAGGGRYWSVASWYVSDGEAVFTPAVRVEPGVVLKGIITLTGITSSPSGSDEKAYAYNSIFAGFPSTSLDITSPAEFTFAWEVLEVYNASTAADLPRGRTRMVGIDIIDNNGHRPPVSWVTGTADSGFGAEVVVDGASDGEVDVVYPLQ